MRTVFNVLVVLAGVLNVAAQVKTPTGNEARALVPGETCEAEMAAQETHLFKVEVLAGQYAGVVVDHGDLPLKIKLIAPNGDGLLEMLTPYSAQQPARVSLIAATAGSYLLEVSALKNRSATRRVEVRVEELRNASDSDRSLVTAQTLFDEGETLRARGSANDLRASLSKYRAALELWRTLGLQLEQAVTLSILGSTTHNLSQPNDALGYYVEALKLWRLLNDRRRESQTLSGMGWTYYSMGELRKALQHYNEALAIRRELQDKRGQAQTLTTIGQIYRSLGDPQRAIEFYNQSLPLAREAGDKIQEAFALNNFALLHIDLAEYQTALSYVDRALPLWRETENHYGEADALNSAGIIYTRLGEFDRALDSFNQSLAVWRHVGNRLGEADELSNSGIVYLYRGEAEHSTEPVRKAVEILTQALALRRATGQLIGLTETLGNLGLVYEYLGERDKALDLFNQVLKIDPLSPNALHNIGLNYYFRNDSRKALEYFNRSLVIFKERGNRAGEAETLRMIGEVQSRFGNLNEALASSRAALNIIESVWANIASSEVRTSYHAVTRDYYVQLIGLLFKHHELNPGEGSDVAALEINERARARGLIDLLLERRIEINNNTPDPLLEREQMLRRQLSAKEQYRRRLLEKDSEAERIAVENDLRSLESEYLETRARIQANNSRYAALAQPATLSLKEIQEKVLDNDTVLLEYCLGRSRSFLWLVTKSSISSYSLPPLDEIQSAARTVYDLLTERNKHLPGETPQQRLSRLNRADAEYPQAASTLSQMLLGPVVTSLGSKRLVFVTDGILQYIPFAALPVPVAGSQKASKRADLYWRPLIMDHEIVNLPSASVLAILRREVLDRKQPSKSVAVIADPVFSRDDPRIDAQEPSIVSTSERIGDRVDSVQAGSTATELRITRLGRLRFSREEANEIISLAPAATSLRLTDFAASTDMVRSSNLDQYRILHFATHGVLDSRRPELSGLVLSRLDNKGRERDGFLGLRDIYNMKLNADLVVLSGCETALGKDIKGEGLVGLTRGFMYAGASRVVASLWSVEDRATADLMKQFYREILTRGARPAAASGQRRLTCLKNAGGRHRTFGQGSLYKAIGGDLSPTKSLSQPLFYCKIARSFRNETFLRIRSV